MCGDHQRDQSQIPNSPAEKKPNEKAWKAISGRRMKARGAAYDTLKEEGDSRRKRSQIMWKEMKGGFFIWDENAPGSSK